MAESKYMTSKTGRVVEKPTEQKKKYIDAYNSGMKLEEIAEKFNVKTTTVRMVLVSYTDFASETIKPKEDIDDILIRTAASMRTNVRPGQIIKVKVKVDPMSEKSPCETRRMVVKKIYPHNVWLNEIEEKTIDGVRQIIEKGLERSVTLTKFELNKSIVD